jgi:type VI secretion system protein ImpA
MPSAPEVIELEALLAPIPGDNPSGESLQYSGVFDEIREARRADDELNQGEWKRELKVADWDKVIELASESLKTKTKDLLIGAWLSEALLVAYGLVGLRDGLRLLAGLHERFWDTVFPEIDEGDMEARANAMAWIDRQAALVLKRLLLTKSAGFDYSYLEWDPRDAVGSADPEKERKLREAQEEKRNRDDEFRKAKEGTRRVFYEQMWETLEECWKEFRTLDRVMDEKFARQTPGLGAMKKVLEDIRGVVEKIVKEKRIAEPDAIAAGAGEAEGAAESGEVASGVQVSGAVGPIRSRQDAVRRLSEVAEFFRKSEPHSPVAYLVERAVSWTQMPLETLLDELVKDSNAMERIRDTLGIRPQ